MQKCTSGSNNKYQLILVTTKNIKGWQDVDTIRHNYSRILVQVLGEIKEVGTPANLLARPDSVFASMVDETGPANAALSRSSALKAAAGQALDVEEVLAVSSETLEDGGKIDIDNRHGHGHM